jgi:hypothetical protein
VIVDVDQSRRKNVPCAVENLDASFDKITPAATSAGGEDTTLSKGNEGVETVETCADQPDGVDDGVGGAHGSGQYAAGEARALPHQRGAVPDSSHGRRVGE